MNKRILAAALLLACLCSSVTLVACTPEMETSLPPVPESSGSSVPQSMAVSTVTTGAAPQTMSTAPVTVSTAPTEPALTQPSQTETQPEPPSPPVPPAPPIPPVPPTPVEGVTLEYLQSLYQQNPHTVGWVRIDGTRVDYPVMQTPNEPEWRDYYLHRNFQREYEYRGCIYAREACDVFTPSDNVVLYGHNMADHSMFGEILDYRYYNHYLTHRYIHFDTLYEKHTYEIFAIFRTSGTYGVGFPYYQFNDATDEAAFDAFVAECKRLSMYQIDITPTYGDKLLTLSTCDFYITNGRLVVVAMRID